MKFFIDSADIAEIKELAATGLVDGVTTNPTLISKTGRPIKEVIAEICSVIPGPISAEVAATDLEGMLREGRILAKIAKNVAVKVPMTWDGMKACKTLSGEGVMINVTVCFTAVQALIAAKAGASFISPFAGRLDDIGLDGMEVVREIRQVYDNYPNLKTQLLAASIRTINNVKDAALAGADIATIPPAVLKGLVKHPLTDKAIEIFVADWKKSGQTIG
jgi:transaldolase